MKPVALIPARGGSKRLPRKNILDFLGRPLIAWPISRALESGVFSRVIVSTDDSEIASVALSYGAEVINRPDELAQDRSTVVDVCQHALEQMRLGDNPVDDLCCIYATAALITVSDILESYDTLRLGMYDSVMGVSDYELSPLQALEQVDGAWRMRWPEFKSVQSQFFPDLVCSCGMLYWIKADSLLSGRNFYTDRMGIYRIPRYRVCDINTKEDFQLAETKAKVLWGAI